ncbi:MAG: TetR/AcrR family transcriptional regulator [Spirochaetota bacterium]
MENTSGGKKRDAILNAAVAVFVEEGYDLASMDRIAERAEASKRTVYNYFESKELLLQAVLQKVNSECRATTRITYDPTASLESQLLAFVDQKLANLDNQQWVGMMRVLFGILGRHKKLTQQVIGSVHDPDGSVIPFLKAAGADKKLKIDDFELASAVFGALIGGGVWWPQVFFSAPSYMPDSAFRKEIVRTFLARYGTGRK